MPITIQRAPLPSLIQRLAEPRRFVQVVAGPRQVGKTTLVRQALAALGLSAVNVVAVLSLPDMPDAAFQLHVFWGSLLAALAIYGPGRWSVDCWLHRRWG